jgi:hypothetical protein
MFRAAVKGEEIEFNRDLSQLKALRIIAQAEPGANSYRVSPKGSTPALADFSNLSMLGVGADRYLRTHPSLNVFYLCWENAPQMVTPVSGNEFEAKEISDYRFTSNSGGDILNTVLYARYLMFQLAHDIKDLHTSFFLPRMNSLLVVAGETEAEMRDILPPYGNPQLVVGSR